MKKIPIKLNDLLQFSNPEIENLKIRMLTTYSNTTNPLDFFRNNDNEELMNWLFWNYSKKSSWKTALQNQKGVYLITDSLTGKMYVGSAYGKDMLLGRWEAYLKNTHGGNVELKELEPQYIKENFRYSILDIFKSTVKDEFIIARESWWKETLMTRKFGYNSN